MGRPPLDRKDVTVKTTLRLPQRLLDRIAKVAGEGRSSEFVREAVEEKLTRAERAATKAAKPE